MTERRSTAEPVDAGAGVGSRLVFVRAGGAERGDAAVWSDLFERACATVVGAAGARVERMSAEALSAALAGDEASTIQGVMVCASDGAEGVVRLAHQLDEARIPAVFVAEHEACVDALDRAAELTELGFGIVAGHDPTRAAATLLGAMGRQPLIDRLVKEAGQGHRAQGRVQAELDALETELREAARVQQNFAHRPVPEIPGLEVGVIYRPAGYVSGDVFDVEELDEDRVGIFLADAAGHGVPAAMLTLFISRALPKVERIGSRLRVIPPGEALARLNHDMSTRPGASDRFATAVYAVYDRRDRTVTIAGAGHPPPILAGDSGEAERIETDGPLLGVFPDAQFGEVVIRLEAGRSLVLFSDGWEVAFPKKDADAHGLRVPTRTYVDRLTGLARACLRDGSGPAVDAIVRSLDEQAGSLHQPDDVTALVLTGVAIAGAKAA